MNNFTYDELVYLQLLLDSEIDEARRSGLNCFVAQYEPLSDKLELLIESALNAEQPFCSALPEQGGASLWGKD